VGGVTAGGHDCAGRAAQRLRRQRGTPPGFFPRDLAQPPADAIVSRSHGPRLRPLSSLRHPGGPGATDPFQGCRRYPPRWRPGGALAHRDGACPQYRGSVCDWWAFSVHLAHHGIESLVFDFRCSGGDSACPDNKTRGHVVSDVVGALRRLRAEGARKVFVGGASLGGTTSLIAATRISPPVAGVVSLSGELNLGLLVGGPPLNALRVMPSLHVPLLIAASRGDPVALPPDMRLLPRRAATDDKRVLIEPPSYAHAVAMLTHPGLRWSRVTAAIISFIRGHS
jgi:pimeloyl-ACP methyl ester carboxylesterase